MHDVAHVRLMHAHPERARRDDHLHVPLLPLLLHALLHRRLDLCVVECGGEAKVDQAVAHALGFGT